MISIGHTKANISEIANAKKKTLSFAEESFVNFLLCVHVTWNMLTVTPAEEYPTPITSPEKPEWTRE